MQLEKTKIADLVIITPTLFHDERGYFYESFNENKFAELYNSRIHFVQDNQAKSTKNVLRGLHYQLAPYSQSKLVSVIEGEVLDVAVDLRKNSPTFGQHETIILSAENKKQFFVPKGFAHGYVVLSETATFFYKCDAFYNKQAEAGLAYNDPALKIDWKIDLLDAIVSEKDQKNPSLSNALNNFE